MELRALLEDVERLEGGAWSDRLLQASHHRPGMDAAAAARHTALLRLALEEWLRHDHVLAARVRNRPRPRIHAALRLGLLLLEDGHPAHAVVDGLLKELSGLPDAERGLVNAVLRTLLRKDLPLSPLPDPALGRDLWLTDLGMALSLPPWFLRLVEELEGPEALHPAWLHAMKEQLYRGRGLWVRVNVSRWSRRQALAHLRDEGLQVEEAPEHAAFLRLLAPPRGGLLKAKALQDGRLRVQDLSTAGALRLLAVEEGMRVLDLCAAPGGKSLALLDTHPGMNLCAVESDAGRARALERRLEKKARLLPMDALHFTESGWDRILLDVPCSGSGTVGHRPDILRKADPVSDAALALQGNLLRHALGLLAPGGRLVYSTCSLDHRENGALVGPIAREMGFSAQPLPWPEAEEQGGGWFWRPWRGLRKAGRPGAGGAWAIALEKTT